VDGLPDLQDSACTHRETELSPGRFAHGAPVSLAAKAALLLTLGTVVALARNSEPLASHERAASQPIPHHESLDSPPGVTEWFLPDYPQIEAMRDTIVGTLAMCETRFEGTGGSVYGILPAQEYGMIYARDMSTMMPLLPFFYGEEYLRTPVDEFLTLQYGPDTLSADGQRPGAGAISAVIAPYAPLDKASVVSDEELHLINAAFQYYRTAGGSEWLSRKVAGETVIWRLNQALEWLYLHRFEPSSGLIKRGHTTDWGDIKFEPSDSPTDLDPDVDHWTCSIYDQALTYRALLQLAQMNRSVGDTQRGKTLEARAVELRHSLQDSMWLAGAGFYLLHVHLTPLTHPFPEEKIVAISNAIAVYTGLADTSQAYEALTQLEQARLSAGASKPGLSLYPPYPTGFFAHPQMSPGEYQNGGLWDWWGGVQITAEFQNGLSMLALAHLRMVAQDWARHPGQIFEWEMLSTGQGWGSANYASAAATMGEAVIRGLYGVTIGLERAEIRPRLREHDGRISAIHPASGLYASYDYRYSPLLVTLDYGSNHPQGLEIGALLPIGTEVEGVSIDGEDTDYRTETMLEDRYCLFHSLPGTHRAVINLRNR
jgi:hypothetical protein